jgi:hypothetical protein
MLEKTLESVGKDTIKLETNTDDKFICLLFRKVPPLAL